MLLFFSCGHPLCCVLQEAGIIVVAMSACMCAVVSIRLETLRQWLISSSGGFEFILCAIYF